MNQNSSNLNMNRSQIAAVAQPHASWSSAAGTAARTIGPQTMGNKYELCKTWLEDGACLQPNCNFAHGQKELMKANSLADSMNLFGGDSRDFRETGDYGGMGGTGGGMSMMSDIGQTQYASSSSLKR